MHVCVSGTTSQLSIAVAETTNEINHEGIEDMMIELQPVQSRSSLAPNDLRHVLLRRRQQQQTTNLNRKQNVFSSYLIG